MFGDDVFRVLGGDLCVKCIVGDDFHDGAFFAEAEAAHCDDFHFAGDAVLFDGCPETVRNALTGRGFAPCTAADKNLEMLCAGRQSAALLCDFFITFFAQ